MFMVALVFFIMYPLFYYATRKRERNVFLGELRKFWCKLAFKLGFYGHHFEYEQPIDFSKPMVIVANHSSYLDTPLICVGIAGDYHFMGKVELLKHPVLKLFFQTVDVPVDRDSKIASYRALKKVEQNVKEGQSLILYPEGTMSLIAPEMLEFKSGAFKIAIDCDVPILPVTFLNNYLKIKYPPPPHKKNYLEIPQDFNMYVLGHLLSNYGFFLGLDFIIFIQLIYNKILF
jgi:1-acyl-sn-glycerol-3-phosphate acyltransferase